MNYLTNSTQYFNKYKKQLFYYPHPDVRIGRLFLPNSNGERFQGDTRVHVSPRASMDMTGDIRLSPWVVITHQSHLITHYHNHSGTTPLLLQEEELPLSTTHHINKHICSDVWIYSSTILPQCNRIARGVIIGAMSVVTKPITEEYSIWAGNPARRIGSRKE